MREGVYAGECHPAARFRGGLASIIESHKVVHFSPAEDWPDGLYLGNGDIAAMVFGEPQCTRILLNKGDIWDERSEGLPHLDECWSWEEVRNAILLGLNSGDWSAYDKEQEKRPKGGGGNFASFQPAGYLDILGDLPGSADGFRQELSIYRARVVGEFEHQGRRFGFETYTHARSNLVIVDLHSEAPEAWPVSLRLHRNLKPFRSGWEGDPAMGDPAFNSDGDTMWMTMVFPDGFAYAVVLQVPGVALDVKVSGGGVTGGLRRLERVRCLLTIVTGDGAAVEDLVERGRAQLKDAVQEEGLDETHERWWADFWRKAWISLPDKVVENLWYTELYKVASCSREGGQAPGQLGHWSGYPDPPWRGDYHTNINIQENYWPIYTANHVELGAPFYDLYLGMLDRVKEETFRFFGRPGARYPRGHGKTGRDALPGGIGYAMWPGAGPWICAHFWRHYQFTKDRDFLRSCYPMFPACLDFILAYVEGPDADGRYSIVPSMSHEQRHGEGPGADFGRNSPFDLGILREHLRNTLEASEILGEDDGKRPGWRRILENLAPYPVSEGGYLTEWEGIELDNSHRHFSHLYPIFPGEDIHQGSDPEDLQVGHLSLKRTIERGFERYVGFSFGWLACVAARVGEGDTALELIQDHIRSFVNVNGFSVIGDSRHPVFGKGYFSPRRGPDWQGVSLLNMESGSGLAAAINELLLCSPRGTIRAFPALPKEWSDVRFSRLRAQGAFLVTSEVRAGRICYVLLESEAGSECRLADPWPGEGVVVRNGQGRQVQFRIRGQQIRFDTETGEHYVVSPEAIALSDLEMVVVTGDAGAIPRFGIGGSFERLIAEQGWQPARRR